MFAPSKSINKLDRVLDTLATRSGIIVVLVLLIAFGGSAGIYVQSVVARLEQNHHIFEANQARNGYVAISDMQRLILVAQNAVAAGEVTPDLDRNFRDAADMMFVRTQNFQLVMTESIGLESGERAVRALQDFVGVADQNIAAGFPDNATFLADLLSSASEARKHLVQFLDDMRRQADIVLKEQSEAVKTQRTIVVASLIGLTLFGAGALVLLRREVIGRRHRARAEQRVQFLAFYDQLTGLPNRTQFQDHLRTMLDQKQPLALFLIDLDDFKMINDTYGHSAGDGVLRHTGRYLTAIATEIGGFAARLGGDEFALIVNDDQIPRLKSIGDDLLAATKESYRHEGEIFAISISIGLATSTQVAAHSEPTIDLLTRVTDFALYASKANGRRCYTVYDHVLEQKFWDRRSMIEELPFAVANDELEVYLQPKVNLPNGEVFGFEALVRWRRNGQITPPSEFILIAEESGLIIDIDNYVLEKATQLIAIWNKNHGTDFSVSVNLSALHFGSEKVIGVIEHATWSNALPPRLLTLEITESMEMRDWKQARATIAKIKDLGCKIAIDDFGTGYSSLAYLRMIRADELKVDRSLVEELETSQQARLLLASVFEIGKTFNLTTVVEGIETKDQARIAHELGARAVQGYYYGRPLPAIEALEGATAGNLKKLDAKAS